MEPADKDAFLDVNGNFGRWGLTFEFRYSSQGIDDATGLGFSAWPVTLKDCASE